MDTRGHTPTHARHPSFTLPPDTSSATLELPESLGVGAHIPAFNSARTPCAGVGYIQCLGNFPRYPKSGLGRIYGVFGSVFSHAFLNEQDSRKV